MLIIHTALSIEAKILIEYFKLKKNVNFNYFDYFSNQDLRLIVSGVGKTKTATAISSAITYEMNITHKEEIILLNVGLAGATNDYGVGDIFQINKIIDKDQDKRFYPDIILKNPIAKSAITCFSKPIDNTYKFNGAMLVDMESSAFFEAGSCFFTPHKLQLLKIVSDNLDPNFFSKYNVSKLLENNLQSIVNFINDYILINNNQSSIQNKLENSKVIIDFFSDLKATTSQREIILKLLKNYEIYKSKDAINFISSFYYEPSNSKELNKMTIKNLISNLNQMLNC